MLILQVRSSANKPEPCIACRNGINPCSQQLFYFSCRLNQPTAYDGEIGRDLTQAFTYARRHHGRQHLDGVWTERGQRFFLQPLQQPYRYRRFATLSLGPRLCAALSVRNEWIRRILQFVRNRQLTHRTIYAAHCRIPTVSRFLIFINTLRLPRKFVISRSAVQLRSSAPFIFYNLRRFCRARGP